MQNTLVLISTLRGKKTLAAGLTTSVIFKEVVSVRVFGDAVTIKMRYENSYDFQRRQSHRNCYFSYCLLPTFIIEEMLKTSERVSEKRCLIQVDSSFMFCLGGCGDWGCHTWLRTPRVHDEYISTCLDVWLQSAKAGGAPRWPVK